MAEIERKLGIPRADAAELLTTLTLTGAATGGRRAPAISRARLFCTRLQTLGRELISSLQAYQSQPGSLAIDEILLSGGTSRIPGIVEELARVTGVKVRRARPAGERDVAEFAGAPGRTLLLRGRHRARDWRSDARRQPSAARCALREEVVGGRRSARISEADLRGGRDSRRRAGALAHRGVPASEEHRRRPAGRRSLRCRRRSPLPRRRQR